MPNAAGWRYVRTQVAVLIGAALFMLAAAVTLWAGARADAALPVQLPAHGLPGKAPVGAPQPVLTTELSESAALLRPDSVLFDQYTGLSRHVVASQDFEEAYNVYDCQAADDFTVPAGQTWVIDRIDVAGAYFGAGPAASFNVFIYGNDTVYPGSAVISQTNLLYEEGPQYGDIGLPLGSPITLGSGTYWLSVQANQAFQPNGQWMWRSTVVWSGTEGVWRNPGEGFNPNNPYFQTWSRCTRGYACPYQFAFRLSGRLAGTPAATTTPTGTRTSISNPAPTSTQVHFPPQLTQPVPQPTSACGLNWREEPSPGGANYGALYGVAAFAPDDVWAAGEVRDDVTQHTRALLLHWDGTRWLSVPSPLDPSGFSSLRAISGTSATDIWAAGYTLDAGGYHTLILHWNGVGWSVINSPNVGTGHNYLAGVSASAADNAWAVGYYLDQSTSRYRTLTLRWDGQSWVHEPSPNPGSGAADFSLLSVTTVSSGNAWAVGSAGTGNPALILHWDGTAWSPQMIEISSDLITLASIDALNANDVWAGGSFRDLSLGGLQTVVIIHWDGTQWSRVPAPNVTSGSAALNGISVTPEGEVWAVGASSVANAWMFQWDGAQWSVDTFGRWEYQDSLQAVDALPSGNSPEAWAGGHLITSSLTLVYYDPCAPSPATPTSTPTSTGTATHTQTAIPTATYTATTMPTNTATRTPTTAASNTPGNSPTRTATVLPSVTATRTPTNTPAYTATSTPTGGPTNPPTSTPATPVATPPPCAIQFADVLPGSTFYSFVRCLACAGYINGYPCGGAGEPCNGSNDPYFRPSSNITRGQLAKIVSNAAGFSDPAGSQMFEDVPSGSTFYVWVQRLASRGHIGGYPCGGAGEPCVGPGNLSYFRPGNNATRGQIAKIVSNAAGFSDPAGAQMFEDVAPGSTFYAFVQRLATRTIIGGYPCGGAGEPCVAPGNLPYFRPNNNATRGQTSKILTNTFLQDCTLR